MQAISMREFSRRTAAVLARVTETEEIVITERGRPRWRISAVHGRDSTLTRLQREGRYAPPAVTPVPWPSHPGGPRRTGPEVDALLDGMRGDR